MHIGMQKKRIFLSICTVCLIILSINELYAAPPDDYAAMPPFVSSGAPPILMLVMGRNHKLYYEAYNDASDLNEDGELDVGYNPAIEYYGYFDSYKYYEYSNSLNRFNPVGTTSDKKVPDSGDYWSGDYLNYLTMSRMDCLRKVLYGGYRSTDTATQTILERAFIPQDAHSWGKEYTSIAVDGYDISDYTPLSLPDSGTRHLFASTTRDQDGDNHGYDDAPVLRVLPNNSHRIWEWVAKEQPVCDESLESSGSLDSNDPGNHSEYEDFVLEFATASHKLGDNSVSNIDGSGNPFGDNDYYLTIFSGTLIVENSGEYTFAVDGDDAVEVIIDGEVVAGWYGGHSDCDCHTHTGSIDLNAGQHTLEFRHEEVTGEDTYSLYWNGPDSNHNWQIVPPSAFADLSQTTYDREIGESQITDYVVRVEVCDESAGLEANAKQYPDGDYKPIGILQRYGEDERMYFGLITGSNEKNLSGGVLRSNIKPINNEIDSDTGQFLYKTDSSIEGIIKTIDNLRIVGFQYDGDGGDEYECGWITTESLSECDEGTCPMWGNPIGEMMYESLRYFAGKENPTSEFTYTASNDKDLDLPKPYWLDPYMSGEDFNGNGVLDDGEDLNSNGVLDGFPYCSKPFMLVLSDINPTYDSDQLPGSEWEESVSDELSGIDVESLADIISSEEGVSNHFIGQSGSLYDGACSSKAVSGFGDVRGLCPEEPTKQGSYYSAAVAYHGRETDLHSTVQNQTVETYSVGLASPLPEINIDVGDDTINLVPFAKSVAGSAFGGESISSEEGEFQPTNTIVDFFVEQITPTYGKFRINFEDVEQGADHDMDAIVEYEYQVQDSSGNSVVDPADGERVEISLNSTYAAGSIIQHIGYIISGTQNDGTYLEVRDEDTGSGSDPDYFLDTPPSVAPGGNWDDDSALPLSTSRVFQPGANPAASLLKNPLWYSAKWGNFDDFNNNGIPDQQSEWDKDGDGIPDAYFYVQNPLRLEQQLNKAFTDILKKTASGTSISSLTEKSTSGSLVNQAVFYPEKEFTSEHKVSWLGYLYTYWFLNKENAQNLREDTNQNLKLEILDDYVLEFVSESGAMKINAYNSSSNGTRDEVVTQYSTMDEINNLWEGGEKLESRSASDRDVYAVNENDILDEFRATDKDLFDAYLGSNVSYFPGCLNSTGSPDYTALINYARGENVPGCRSRKTGSGTWKLGDIVYSTPLTVKYDDYSLVYVAANDGMLHAFRLGRVKELYSSNEQVELCQAKNDCGPSTLLGKEEWAFIPKDVLPYLRFRADPEYSHMYLHDLKPYLIEFKDEYESGEEYTRKILIGGMRFGGGCANGDINPPADTAPVGRSAYYALDITDPQDPEYLWRFAPEGMGFTYSGPAYIKRQDDNGDWHRFVLFASGPTDYDGTSTQDLKTYTVDLIGGPSVYNSTWHSGSSDLKYAFGGRLFNDGVDVNEDGQTDFVLLGYSKYSNAQMKLDKMKGGIVKIYTGSIYPSNWDYNTGFLPTFENPITAPVKFMRCFPNKLEYPYIYFGTGRYFIPNDQTFTNLNDVNKLFGVPFVYNATNISGHSSNISNINDSSDLECDDIGDNNPNNANWMIPLNGPSGSYLRERSYSTPTTTEHNIVFFNTAMPTSDLCAYGGRSRSWAVNCASGWSLGNDTCERFAVDQDKFNFLVQLSTGAIEQYSQDDFTEEGGRATPWAEGMVSEEGGVPAFPGGGLEILYWREW